MSKAWLEYDLFYLDIPNRRLFMLMTQTLDKYYVTCPRRDYSMYTQPQYTLYEVAICADSGPWLEMMLMVVVVVVCACVNGGGLEGDT